MSTTVTMLAPDGSSGEIPQDKVQDAMKAGFKRAYSMTAPDGKTGYVPEDRIRDAQLKGFRVTQAIPLADQRPSYWEALTNPVGSGGREQGLLGGALQVGGQAIRTMAQPIMHPIDTLAGAAKLAGTAITSPYAAALDVAQPVAQQYAADKAAGGHALALENLGGQALGTYEGGRLAGAAVEGVKPSPALGPVNRILPSAVERGVIPSAWNTSGAGDLAGRVQQYVRPSSSPSIVPRQEMAVRNLAAAVLPDAKDVSSFIEAGKAQIPAIKAYAEKTGNPLNTTLEWEKAAQGNAQEKRAFYDENLLDPVKDNMVRTTGSGYGRQTGEGPDTYASLGDIDKRITQINDELRTRKMNPGDVRTALAGKSEVELKQEASSLRDVLHPNLSQSSGWTPEQVANLRQDVGQSYEIANDTAAANNRLMLQEGKSKLQPVKLGDIPGKTVNLFRGAPSVVRDRAFQKAISSFPTEANPVPVINPPTPAPATPQRPSLSTAAGIQAQPNPLGATAMSPEVASAQTAAMNKRLAARASAIEDAASAQRAENLLRAQRFEQLLSLARKQQAAARTKP